MLPSSARIPAAMAANPKQNTKAFVRHGISVLPVSDRTMASMDGRNLPSVTQQ
jgi:hypothetical protein